LTGSSPRFDVYGNDFGWGRPVAVRSGAGNKCEGKVTVYEGRGGAGSMALEVCLTPRALDRLVADEEFMEAVSAAGGGMKTEGALRASQGCQPEITSGRAGAATRS
jgi:hypothetical protein